MTQPQHKIESHLDKKFSFFKKDNEETTKESKLTKFKIAIFMSFIVFGQFISTTQYDKDSISFQEKSFSSWIKSEMPAPSAANKLSKIELENFLLASLNKKSLSYEEMDALMKMAKINKKEIPSYVYSHIIEKTIMKICSEMR